MTTPTITEFLLARIAEDKEAAQQSEATWTSVPSTQRVLAECEAKRRIVELHEPVDNEPNGWCTVCDGDGWPCATMSALASVYADCPDYRDEWRV